MAFQKFFEALTSWIGFMDLFEKVMSDEEKEFAMLATYIGVIYRYWGYGNPDNKERVEIEYNEIYVFRSKMIIQKVNCWTMDVDKSSYIAI